MRVLADYLHLLGRATGCITNIPILTPCGNSSFSQRKTCAPRTGLPYRGVKPRSKARDPALFERNFMKHSAGLPTLERFPPAPYAALGCVWVVHGRNWTATRIS